MNDYEWATGRTARPNAWGRVGETRRTNRSLEEFAALEYPKENAAWLLRSAELHRSTPSLPAEQRLPDPSERAKRRRRDLRSDA